MHSSRQPSRPGRGTAAGGRPALTSSPSSRVWIILLPLIGFLINGWLALSHGRKLGRRGAPRAASSTWADAGLRRPLDAHASLVDRPRASCSLAFAITLVNFLRMLSVRISTSPSIVSYWTWMATGDVPSSRLAAIQLDQLSMIMMMVVTGVGFLIHVFSVGYMKEDPGYPRYFAYLNLFVFFMLVLVMGSSLPAHVRRLGRRGALLVSADRVLVQGPREGGRRQEGVHRQPDRGRRAS